MNKGIKNLLHDRKKITLEVITKCITIYAEKYNLKEILLSNGEKRKEEKYQQKFGKMSPQFLHTVELHIELNFSMFLSIVTQETGVQFKERKVKKRVWEDEPGINRDACWGYLAYNNVADDF